MISVKSNVISLLVGSGSFIDVHFVLIGVFVSFYVVVSYFDR